MAGELKDAGMKFDVIYDAARDAYHHRARVDGEWSFDQAKKFFERLSKEDSVSVLSETKEFFEIGR